MKKLAYVGAGLLLPLFAFAADIESLGDDVLGVINKTLVPIVFAIAFLVFIWGVFEYFIQGSHDEEKRTEGRQKMLYGLIGFFIMVSVWGLVNIIIGTFEVGDNDGPAGGLPSSPEETSSPEEN